MASVLSSVSLRCASLLSNHAPSLIRAAQCLPRALCQVPGGFRGASSSAGSCASRACRTLSASLPSASVCTLASAAAAAAAVAVAGAANTTSSVRGFATKPVELPPSSFESAFRDLGRHAADPACPAHTKQVLERVNKTLGGCWLMVSCGDLLPGPQEAPRPAYALLHVAFGLVMRGQQRLLAPTISRQQGAMLDAFDEALSPAHGSGNTSVRAPSVEPQDIDFREQPIPSHQLDPTCMQLFYPAVYELDERGWPTGRLFNSATDFEQRTTLANHKRTDQSFRLVSGGATLGKWLSVALGQHLPFQCEKPGKKRVWACRQRYNQLVKAAGVEVMDKEDAPQRSLRHKEQKGSAENEAPQGVYSSDTPRSLLPQRPRKTSKDV